MMLSELLFPSPFLFAAFSVVYFFFGFFVKRPSPRLPRIPIIGAHKGDWFPLFQAKWRNTKDFKAAMELAHEHYREEAVLLPVAITGTVVMLPPSEIEFITNQPDSVLSLNERAFEIYQVDYTFMDPIVPRTTLHENLLRTALTPQIGNLIPDLADEMEWAFEQHWGTTQPNGGNYAFSRLCAMS